MQFYRNALEVFGFLPSDAIVNAAVQIEWLWYITPFKPFYRDHLAHVMKVAVIALDLLDHPNSPFSEGGQSLLDRVVIMLASPRTDARHLRISARRAGVPEADLEEPEFWRAAVLETTRLAGLLHDMAYPDVMAVKVERAARPVRPRAPFEPGLEDTCRNAVTWLQHHLVAAPFYRSDLPGPDGIETRDRDIAAAVFKESHSLRAGYSLLRILDDARRVGALTPFDIFVMEWAALAISLHDYDKFFSEKHTDGLIRAWLYTDDNWRNICPTFDKDPVSFLIAFADQIQDFGRMSYEISDDDDDAATAQARYPVSAVEVEKDSGGTLSLTFELGSGTGTFAPKDGSMIADIARDKHRGAAFANSKRPGSADMLRPWLVPGSLYTEARIRVRHDGIDYGIDGSAVPVTAR
ncbi:hypothetical protein [Sorangium sp. So ce233]|uniref:hypothetical protein n=1 Tax=Sorangium sp. So ce233 TaxID=3133290 RepID=UPI003F5F9E78